MRILFTIFVLSFMFSSTASAKPQGGPATSEECRLIGGKFTHLGGGMTSCCTDKGCSICDKTGCHFDEAMGGKTKPKKPIEVKPKSSQPKKLNKIDPKVKGIN